jgi:hypothetical protein
MFGVKNGVPTRNQKHEAREALINITGLFRAVGETNRPI